MIGKLIAQILIMLIKICRPLLGPAACKFPVTCTPFAIMQLEDQPLLTALKNILVRVLSCNPFYGRRWFT